MILLMYSASFFSLFFSLSIHVYAAVVCVCVGGGVSYIYYVLSIFFLNI